MANTTTTPNMNLPVPVPGEDPGPDWATNVVADMTIIDAHSHTTGNGVPVPSAGLNINSDLPMNGNNLTTTRSVNFFAQGAPLALATDVGCIYESGVDLWYNDGIGNQVRLTQGGSPAGGAGSITGLPSGTASASFAAGTFTFQGATSTPATMAVGPLVVGAAVASSKTVTIAPSASLANNYSITLPLAPPGATSILSLDPSGNMGYASVSGSGGALVLQNGATLTSPTLITPDITSPAIHSPVFTGLPSGSIQAGTYSPTVVANFGTVSAVLGFSYMRMGTRVLVDGTIDGVTTGTGGQLSVNISLPVIPTNNFSSNRDVVGVLSCSGSSIASGLVNANIGAKTALAGMSGQVGVSITINVHFAYDGA